MTSIHMLRDYASAMKAKQFLMIAVVSLAGSVFAQQVDGAGPKPVQLPEAVAMRNLTEVVAPRRPDDATHVQGKVVMRIVIDQDGKLEKATVLSGPPMLASASLDAVKQWKFRPYRLNNEPVEIETTATMEFIEDPPYVITPKPYSGPVRIRVSSGVQEGLILHKVQPRYPADAKARHIQGDVVLRAAISRDGSVADLKPVSGDPALTEAAIQAVRQWKYKPFLINGEPVEVETMITIRFHM